MTYRILLIAFSLLITASPTLAQDDLLEKIKLLEQQIQDLKTLKEQQNIRLEKTDHCMKIISSEKQCACISNSLPRATSFELYVHTLLTPKESLGYLSMTQDQKNEVDAIINVHDKCNSKGFFK